MGGHALAWAQERSRFALANNKACQIVARVESQNKYVLYIYICKWNSDQNQLGIRCPYTAVSLFIQKNNKKNDNIEPSMFTFTP